MDTDEGILSDMIIWNDQTQGFNRRGLSEGVYSFTIEKKGKCIFKSEDIEFKVPEKPEVVKIDKNKGLFNYEKKVLIKDLILDLKLGYYNFEKEKPQKVKFTLEVNYEDKKPSNDKDLKSIVNYDKIVKLIKKLVKNKHYNFLETLAEDVFDELFKDRRIDKISLQIEKLEIMKDCSSVGIQISKKRSHAKL